MLDWLLGSGESEEDQARREQVEELNELIISSMAEVQEISGMVLEAANENDVVRLEGLRLAFAAAMDALIAEVRQVRDLTASEYDKSAAPLQHLIDSLEKAA